MHEISLLWIPKQRPCCKPNPETGSRDYKFLTKKMDGDEIENSIPGLQSLLTINVTEVWQTSSSEDFLFDRQFIQDVCVTSVISSRTAENLPRHWHLKDTSLRVQLSALYRVGQKNWTCLSADNSAMVSGRKTCNTSKVSEWCKSKWQICILKHLNILCLICINIRHLRNSAKFDCNTWI